MILAAILGVALVVTVYLFLRHIAQLEAAWTVERRELLNRIQHPEIVATPSVEHCDLPDPEPDERELVGTITFENEDFPDA